MKENTLREWYCMEWFSEELKATYENPVTSGLTSQFNRYIAKVRSGEWGPNEEWIAESLLRVGMNGEQRVLVPNYLKQVKAEPLKLELSFVKFMSGLKEKTINKQEFSWDELLLVSRLLLVGVLEEAAIEIEKEQKARFKGF